MSDESFGATYRRNKPVYAHVRRLAYGLKSIDDIRLRGPLDLLIQRVTRDDASLSFYIFLGVQRNDSPLRA